MRRAVQEIHEIATRIAGAAGDGLLPATPSPAGVWTPPQPALAEA
jgi:hypothetical protein